MTPIVLDASVGIPLVHSEAGSGRWRELVARWHREMRAIVVPAFFWLEVANPLMTRHRYSGAEVLEALHRLDDVVTETVEVARPTLLLALDLAERSGLTLYDATYLALAETMDASLATADEALRSAAGARLADLERPRRLSEMRAAYVAAPSPTWPDYSGAAAYLGAIRARLQAGASR